jgi:DNA-binding transcriptional MerR regulator
LFTAEENLDAAMTGRQKQRAIDLANTELALDASLAKLRGNLDTTALAWKKSGATMDDVIKAWSKETGLSIDEVIDRMDDLDVDTTDLQATLETFTDETGANFWDMAKEAREALQQIADDLQMDKSWEGFIRGQDETVIAMRENSISFNDIMGELVGQFEGDTDAMVAALKEAGVAGQDTWGLLGSSFGSVVRDIVDGWDEIVDAADDSAKRLAAIAMQAAAMQAAAPAMQKSGWAVNPVGASFDTAVFNKFSEEQKNIARGIDWDALSNAQLQEMAQSSQEIIRLSASHQRFKRGGGSSGYRAGNVLTSESGTWANFQAAKLALGGIVNRPTLAMLGESGPEAVVPLGRGGAGMTVNLVINGDINGMDDFEQKVSSVIRDAVLGGGFSGVLARA